MIHKKLRSFTFVISAVLLSLPALIFAFTPPPTPGTIDVFVALGTIIDAILAVLWAIAVTVVIFTFVLAGFKFFTAQGEPGKIREARIVVIYGLVGTVVILLSVSVLFTVRNLIGV